MEIPEHFRPALLAEVGEDGSLHAWCPWCAVRHRHARGLGRRSAACPDGPFRRAGYYYLVIEGDADDYARRYLDPHERTLQRRELVAPSPGEPCFR